MLYISSYKLFSFLKYLSFCPDFFGHVEKQLDKKARVNFNDYNRYCHLSQKVKAII